MINQTHKNKSSLDVMNLVIDITIPWMHKFVTMHWSYLYNTCTLLKTVFQCTFYFVDQLNNEFHENGNSTNIDTTTVWLLSLFPASIDFSYIIFLVFKNTLIFKIFTHYLVFLSNYKSIYPLASIWTIWYVF